MTMPPSPLHILSVVIDSVHRKGKQTFPRTRRVLSQPRQLASVFPSSFLCRCYFLCSGCGWSSFTAIISTQWLVVLVASPRNAEKFFLPLHPHLAWFSACVHGVKLVFTCSIFDRDRLPRLRTTDCQMAVHNVSYTNPAFNVVVFGASFSSFPSFPSWGKSRSCVRSFASSSPNLMSDTLFLQYFYRFHHLASQPFYLLRAWTRLLSCRAWTRLLRVSDA